MTTRLTPYIKMFNKPEYVNWQLNPEIIDIINKMSKKKATEIIVVIAKEKIRWVGCWMSPGAFSGIDMKIAEKSIEILIWEKWFN